MITIFPLFLRLQHLDALFILVIIIAEWYKTRDRCNREKRMKESLLMSFPWLKTNKLVTTTLNTFLLFYAKFTNVGRGRKGAVASRPIHLTEFAVVFLPAQHSLLRRSMQLLAQRTRHARREKNKLTPTDTLMFALFQSFIWRTQILIFILITWCILWLSWKSMALTLKEEFFRVLELLSYSDDKGRTRTTCGSRHGE